MLYRQTESSFCLTRAYAVQVKHTPLNPGSVNRETVYQEFRQDKDLGSQNSMT